MKRAVVYTRASLDSTGERHSVDRQAEACRALALARGWEVLYEESDNSISGYGDKVRPGWLRVLERVDAGEVDVVVAWHLDRLTRSMLDLEKLIGLAVDRGVGVATATGDIDLTTDVGRMVARILAAVARAEVERKAARQRLANEQRASAGRPWSGGARPFGYTATQDALVPEEAAAIQEAAVRALAGASMRSIARDWEAAGLLSSRASATTKGGWTGRGVKNVLVSPRYAGIRTYQGREVGPGQWPAVLDLETHLALKAKLSDPARTMAPARRGRTASNLLSGIARCGECEGTVNGSSNRGVLTYTCRPHSHVNPPRDAVDREVSEHVLGLLSSRGFLAALAPVGHDRADRARDELDGLHSRQQALGEAFVDGAVDPALFRSLSARLAERIAAAEGELLQASTGSALVGIDVGTEAVVQQWLGLDLVRQRAVIDLLLDVELLPAGPGGRGETRLWTAEENLRISRRAVPE